MSKAAAFLFMTRACNLSCSHCYVSASPAAGGHMSLKIFTRILDLLKEHQINDVRLTGGEPMIHPQFAFCLDELNVRGIRPRLITNGIRLLNHHSPRDVLDTLSGCWISLYGLTQEQHRRIGGRAVKPLDEILSFVGKYTHPTSWIGISVLLTEVIQSELQLFIESANRVGIEKLRFLFSEPTGRAVNSGAVFTDQDRAKSIRNSINQLPVAESFSSLTINNPFDLDGENSLSGYNSCLLHDRKMWSFSSDGGIYSCCFNVGDKEHFVANVDNRAASLALSSLQPGLEFAPKCRGISSGYWEGDSCAHTCPISAVDVCKTRGQIK